MAPKKNFSAEIRKRFLENNICGQDLQHLKNTQLQALGMEEHNVARFNLLTEELLK